jgi:hypothetical protein
MSGRDQPNMTVSEFESLTNDDKFRKNVSSASDGVIQPEQAT